jgi:hypothetical protein
MQRRRRLILWLARRGLIRWLSCRGASRLCAAGCLALVCADPAGAAMPSASAGATVVDAVVGAVNSTVITASDIALARALGLFGFAPSKEPIRTSDVDRYGAAIVAALEASRLGIGPTLTELDEAWTALEARIGGSDGLRAWLEATTIDVAWARRALEAHLRWHTWQTLHEGLTIETPGAPPPAMPALESDLILKNLLPAPQTVPAPFAMPPRAAP